MRVVHVITKLELGGAQQNTLYTLAHLDEKKFSGLLVTGTEGLLVDEAKRSTRYDKVFLPEFVREVRPLLDARALRSLTSLLRREVSRAGGGGAAGPVVVHTHSSKAGILGRIAAKLAGVPVVIHSIHGYGFHDRQHPVLRRFYIFLERLVARWTTHFIAVSRANIDLGLRLGLFGEEKVSLIRSGIDIRAFQGEGVDTAAKRASLGAGSGQKLVGMVACLKPQKNPVDFVRMAAVVAEKVPEAVFVLAGDGVLRRPVEEEVRRQGLGGRFTLLGWRQDVAEIIPSLDVLVLTSLWEGLPRVFPQAMAAAKPVVGYRVDGAPEAIADGVNGYLVDPGDYRSAASRVAELLGDPAKAAAFGAAGASRAGEFDARLMVRRQEELYLRLSSRAASSPDRA